MANLVVENVYWKQGETNVQRFNIVDSDNSSAHPLTGHSYTLKFWKVDASVNKGSGSLTIIDAVNGVADYAVQTTDTDTVNTDGYLAEIYETDTGLKTKTFKIYVLATAPQ